MKQTTKLLTALALLLTTVSSNAQTSETLKTERVSVFRNNLAYFQRSAVSDKDGVYRINGENNIPAGRFGTLWVNSKDKLKSIRVYQTTDSITAKYAAMSLPQLLKANITREAKLQTTTDTLVGIIEDVMIKSDLEGLVYLTSSSQGWQALPLAQIVSVQFSGKPNTTLSEEIGRTEKTLEINFQEPKLTPFEISYLQRGLTWNPLYNITLTDDRELTVNLVAEMINDAEDIQGATIDFMSSAPSFAYASQLSKLLKDPDPRSRFYEVEPRRGSYVSMDMEIAYDAMEVTLNSSKVDGLSDGVQISQAKEQKLYTLDGVTIKSGERAHFDLLSATLDYQDLYTCTMRNDDLLYTVKEYDVYHSLLIENNTKLWFAAAPAYISSSQSGEIIPLAQGLLKDTPVGATSQIDMSQSHDIEVEVRLNNIKIEDEKIDFNNRKYSKKKVEGKIIITSHKDKDINLRIDRAIVGDSIESKTKWEIISQQGQRYNPGLINMAQWNVKVPAGEVVEIEFSYYDYIP